MSGFLSRLYIQQSQALVFQPYSCSPVLAGNTEQGSEEDVDLIGSATEEIIQVNLLAELREMQAATPTDRVLVQEAGKYQHAAVPKAAQTVPVVVEHQRKKASKHYTVEKAKVDLACPYCSRKFRSGKALGVHKARGHSKKIAVKSASSPRPNA